MAKDLNAALAEVEMTYGQIRQIADDMLYSTFQPINELVDISIPFEDLGIKKGQKLEMFFIAGCNGICRTFMPKDSLVEVVRPK